jgi:uncharacterized protein YggE
MKQIPRFLLLALLAGLLIACAPVQAAPALQAAATPFSSTALPPDERSAPVQARETERTITVVGEGAVSLVPDMARINVGAEVRADSVAEARDEVDRQVSAIREALSELGIADKDIQTDHYSIHLEREPMPFVREGPAGPPQEGYRVSNMLRVTVRDVDLAGDVLDAAVAAGANQVYGVNFTVSDPDAWQGQARQKAMADAYARAAELVDLANELDPRANEMGPGVGLELGEVRSVSEVIGGIMPSMIMRGIGGGGGGFAPGELEMSTQVQVTFALR